MGWRNTIDKYSKYVVSRLNPIKVLLFHAFVCSVGKGFTREKLPFPRDISRCNPWQLDNVGAISRARDENFRKNGLSGRIGDRLFDTFSLFIAKFRAQKQPGDYFLPAWRNFCVIRLGRRFLHAFIVTYIQCEIESIMVWTWSYACAWGSSHLLYGYAFTSSREVKRFSKSV